MLFRNAASAGTIIVLLAATPSLADLAAEDVWSAWKDLVEGYGQTVTGTERRDGDRLTIEGLVLSWSLPDSATAVATFGELVFTERGDGSVEIGMPAEIPIDVTTADQGAGAFETRVLLIQPGLSMVASGVPEEVVYDMAAPVMSVTLDRMKVDGEPVDARMNVTLEEMAADYTISRGNEMTDLDSSITATTTRFDMAVNAPEQGMVVDYRGEMRGLSSTSTSSVPSGMQASTLGPMLAAGLTARGRIEHEGMDYSGTIADAGGPTAVGARFADGSADFELAEGGMLYDVRSGAGTITFAGAAMPMPQVDLGFDATAFTIRMPLVETEEPTDIALAMRYEGLTLGDGIWMMFDPAGQLPRDPMTLVVDLGGKARLLTDLTNPVPGAAPEVPGEIHALNVKELKLSMAGADLTGAGGFTFDNSDTTTFDGMPKPTGSLSLRLEGGNTLLDRLVNMGMVPQEKAMGFRMMLGMFARPTGAGDEMTSDITVTEDGQVLANGMRVR